MEAVLASVFEFLFKYRPVAFERGTRVLTADAAAWTALAVGLLVAVPALVTREQAYFLRENLRLRLLSARVAILGRQEASYKADLRAALAWTRQYFDMRTKQGQHVQETLAQMLSTPMPDDLPDLGASLDAVRALKAAQEHGVPLPVPARPNR